MKWLRTLAFLVAVRSSYSRTVQPVTYSHTTTSDGEYTTYQGGVHRPHNLHTTPYSRHPSVLTHHYYDPPAENKKVEFVAPAATSPSPALNQTRKVPRKKNDYVAKVSYVRDSGSVSFATTIENKNKEQHSTESPMRKLMVVRKRRPLKPVDMIPVKENNNEEHQVSNANRVSSENITVKTANLGVTSPTEVHYNEVKKSEIGVDVPTKVNTHKIRKIRLKPTTASTTASTISASLWQDILHRPENNTTTPARQLTTNRKKIKYNNEKTSTIPALLPSAFDSQKLGSAVPAPENSSDNTRTFAEAQLMATTSPQPITTTTTMAVKFLSGKYTPNYKKNFEYHDTKMTQLTQNQSQPLQESSSDDDVDEDVPVQEDVEVDEETVDLEYPDEYNDLSDEEESLTSSGNDEETDRNAEDTNKSPVKLLKKPLRYSYSGDQKQSATDDNNAENGENEVTAGQKVDGEVHHKNHHQTGSNKGDIGYEARKTHDHAKKGISDQKSHQNQYEVEGNHKKKDEEERGHLNEHEIEAAGKKAAKFAESGKHEKGHSTKGSHNVHKKDEYMKNYEFYDEHHEGDSHQKYNDFVKKHKGKHGGALKHAHKNKDYSEGHKSKKNKHLGGHHLHKGLHHLDDHSSNNHYGGMKKYQNQDGLSKDNKWKYEKGENSEDESQSQKESTEM